jgi:pimeloyl-ACP methyl ester carboxylesterase
VPNPVPIQVSSGLEMQKEGGPTTRDLTYAFLFWSLDECVVITGHSQGGAIALVAALYLADLNPYVITFGQPPTVEAPCNLVTSDRVYRWVNTKNAGASGIAYDPVPMAPGLGKIACC